MKNKFISTTIILFFLLTMEYFGHALDNQVSDRSEKKASSLRILTINVWSGLDYKGTFRMGEYEKKAERDKRFQLLVKEIKKIKPDVIFLQEANPVGSYSARLAQALNFNKIHQVALGGIKLGPLGIPCNLKEGNAILARPELRLKTYDVWKLSGSFGLFGDIFTCHLNESIFALAGRIVVDSTPIFLVNTHLVGSPSAEPEVINQFRELLESGEISEDEYKRGLKKSNAVHCAESIIPAGTFHFSCSTLLAKLNIFVGCRVPGKIGCSIPLNEGINEIQLLRFRGYKSLNLLRLKRCIEVSCQNNR